MTDTHTHLYMEQFGSEGASAVERALNAGVSRLIFPAVDLGSFQELLKLADSFPDNIFIAIGIHPSEVTEHWREDFEKMKELAEGRRIVAIGEIGLDFHWEGPTAELQKEAFIGQMEYAAENRLPVIIHSRDALPETLWAIDIVHERSDKESLQLLFHSFTGSREDVKEIRRHCNPMFGINGVVTFKNAGPLKDAVKEIGLPSLLLETDSPYLAPVPYRGKRNESAYIGSVATECGILLQTSPEEIEEITDRNATDFFKLN